MDFATPFTDAQKRQAIAERDILTSAKLSEIDAQGVCHYVAQGGMRVNASVKRTRAILTDYSLYSQMIHYVSRSQWDRRENVVWLEGGIFKYRLSSWIRFIPQGDLRVHFRFIAGHFEGMQGDILFEDLGERGTWVTIRAELAGKEFPPRFVIENGAKIVFGYTGNRMRTFIERESQAYEEKNSKQEQEARSQKGSQESGPETNQEAGKKTRKTHDEKGQIPQPRKTFAR